MTEVYNVVIVDPGSAGLILAYFLASSGVDVLLVDKAAFPLAKTCGNGLLPRALHTDDNLLAQESNPNRAR